MRVESLHIYPIKSCHRRDLNAVDVEPWGFAGDRRWMIVDSEGRLISQREIAALGRVQPTCTASGLELRVPDRDALTVPFPGSAELVEVSLWSVRVKAAPAGEAADAWLSEFLDRKVSLVHLDDPTRRPIEPGLSRPDDRVSFADGYPVLLANVASLAAVNDWIAEDGDGEPVPMTRFRPNLVISGAEPWAEDGWIGSRVLVGGVPFRAAKACDRCVLTTIDQETGAKGRQPLRTLGRHRRFPDGLLFGLNLIPDVASARVEVGADVSVETPAA